MDKWPSHDALAGAILPTKRIVAFYGNPLSKKMGVLGEYPVDEMLAKFDKAIAEWKEADPSTPVQPALHLIAVVAQGSPGRDGKYRLRMADTLVEKVYGWAQSRHAILFLDIQVGGSTLQEELPRLTPFLSRPDVHLGIDPEFSMHYNREGLPPGAKIGTMDAADVNYAVTFLAAVEARRRKEAAAQGAHRAPLHAADAPQRREDQARSERPGRDEHGRLGPAVAQVRFVRGVHRPRAGAVHRVQALLPQRHEERRPDSHARAKCCSCSRDRCTSSISSHLSERMVVYIRRPICIYSCRRKQSLRSSPSSWEAAPTSKSCRSRSTCSTS